MVLLPEIAFPAALTDSDVVVLDASGCSVPAFDLKGRREIVMVDEELERSVNEMRCSDSYLEEVHDRFDSFGRFLSARARDGLVIAENQQDEFHALGGLFRRRAQAMYRTDHPRANDFGGIIRKKASLLHMLGRTKSILSYDNMQYKLLFASTLTMVRELDAAVPAPPWRVVRTREQPDTQDCRNLASAIYASTIHGPVPFVTRDRSLYYLAQRSPDIAERAGLHSSVIPLQNIYGMDPSVLKERASADCRVGSGDLGQSLDNLHRSWGLKAS